MCSKLVRNNTHRGMKTMDRLLKAKLNRMVTERTIELSKQKKTPFVDPFRVYDDNKIYSVAFPYSPDPKPKINVKMKVYNNPYSDPTFKRRDPAVISSFSQFTKEDKEKERSIINNNEFGINDGRKIVNELRQVCFDPFTKHIRYGRRETKILQTERSLQELESIRMQNDIDRMLNASVSIIMKNKQPITMQQNISFSKNLK